MITKEEEAEMTGLQKEILEAYGVGNVMTHKQTGKNSNF